MASPARGLPTFALEIPPVHLEVDADGTVEGRDFGLPQRYEWGLSPEGARITLAIDLAFRPFWRPTPMNKRPSPPRSLRRLIWLTFAPVAVGVVVALAVVATEVQRMHLNVLRMFEENRELGLVRTLHDELNGIATWVRVFDHAVAAARPMILADQQQHLASAAEVLAKFAIPDDPSSAAHDSEELQRTAPIRAALGRIASGLAAGRGGGQLDADVASATEAAKWLEETIAAEHHEIGANLDKRGEHIERLILLLGIAVTVSLGLQMGLLVRRVLVPLRDLRRAAEQFGSGDLEVRIPLRHHDEFGLLAATFHEMTDRLRQHRLGLEQQVRDRSTEVLRTARLADLGTLAAGIAHEINNPLASIAACAEGLLRDGNGTAPADQARIREYLVIVHKEAMRARDITHRMLDFARQQPGQRRRVQIADELREVAAMFRHQMARGGRTLRLDVATDLPPLLGDPAEWRQVAFNLLKNAMEASPAGGTITVRAAHAAGTIAIEVLDEGPGIAPEHQDRIFEPFFTTKAPGSGTGLGLAIVHRIVTDHGGSVHAANRADRAGACFRIEAPVPTGAAETPPGA